MSSLAYHADHFKSGAVGAIGKHNWEKRGRYDKHSNQDIDPSRSHLNMLLQIPESSLYMAAKNRINEACTGRVTAASNWISETIVYPPDDVVERNDSEELKRYFEDVLEWHRIEFGSENVLAAVAHMDETTPHIHTDLVPLTADGRLTTKEVFARKELFRHHTELAEFLQEKGWDIQRGESTKGKQVRSVSVPEYKKQAEKEKQQLLVEIAELQKENEKLKDDNERKERELQEKNRELELKQQQLQLTKENYDSIRKTVKEKQKEVGDLIVEISEKDRLLFDKDKELAEKESLLRSRDSELQIQKGQLLAISNELQDMAQYQAKAKGCWDKLEEIRNLLLNQYGSKWPLRNRKAERNLLDAIERGRDYIMAAVTAMIAFEVRSNMPQENRASEAINRGLQKSLELVMSEARERSEASETSNFDRRQEKKSEDIEI